MLSIQWLRQEEEIKENKISWKTKTKKIRPADLRALMTLWHKCVAQCSICQTVNDQNRLNLFMRIVQIYIQLFESKAASFESSKTIKDYGRHTHTQRDTQMCAFDLMMWIPNAYFPFLMCDIQHLSTFLWIKMFFCWLKIFLFSVFVAVEFIWMPDCIWFGIMLATDTCKYIGHCAMFHRISGYQLWQFTWV